MPFEKPPLPEDNELPLRISRSERHAEGGDAAIWKAIVETPGKGEAAMALKESRHEEFATDEAMRESKEFYDFLKNFPGFGRFVPDTLYFKARPSPEEAPRAYALQPFLGGDSIDRLSDGDLYRDPETVDQLIEFGENAIALLQAAREEKRLRPDLTKSFDDNRYANFVGNYLFNPGHSNNIFIRKEPDESGRKVFFVDTGANAEDRLDATRAKVQREIATRLQGFQLRRWINTLHAIRDARKRESGR